MSKAVRSRLVGSIARVVLCVMTVMFFSALVLVASCAKDGSCIRQDWKSTYYNVSSDWCKSRCDGDTSCTFSWDEPSGGTSTCRVGVCTKRQGDGSGIFGLVACE